MESTKDGIIALDALGKLVWSNTRLAAIWGFPAEMLARADNSEMVAYAARQVKDPEKFIARTQEAQFIPEEEAFDIVELKDGRMLERRIMPQRIDSQCVGVVVNFRDVTRRKRAERECATPRPCITRWWIKCPAACSARTPRGVAFSSTPPFAKSPECPAVKSLAKPHPN